MKLCVVFDVDWTLCTWDNSVSLGFLAQRLVHHFPGLDFERCATWLQHQLLVLMGNLYGVDARRAAERRVHDVFATWIQLRNGFMPPSAQWSHVCRAGVLLEELGYVLNSDTIARLVSAEEEAFELVARHNALYPDAASTVCRLRDTLGAEVIALTTSDVRVQRQEGALPLFCPQYSNELKLDRLGTQGLFEVIPRDRVIVAEYGKPHPLTLEAVLQQFAHVTGPRLLVKIGDTHTDMELGFAEERVFVVRQLREDGTFIRPIHATHVVHELAEIVPYLSERVRATVA